MFSFWRRPLARPAQKEEGSMTVSLGEQGDVRRMGRDGVPRAQIAREPHLSRNTVAKHADSEDMSPKPPIAQRRAHPATDGTAGWIDAIPEGDLAATGKQRHTARGVFGRAVAEKGYSGSYSSVRKYVAAWKRERLQGPGDGFLEPVWVPGTAQAGFGNFVASVAGLAVPLKLLVVVLPHSNSRFCIALPREGAEVSCRGLRAAFERIGRPPRLLVPGNAAEAGRMLSGRVTEPRPFSRFRAHYRRESRHRNPYPGDERVSAENAVGLLRRNLPVPEASSLDEPDGMLRAGCDRMNAQARNGEGKPAAEALPGGLAGVPALPGTPFDAVRWTRAKPDRLGCVRADGSLCCAGPAWHGRVPLVGVRARAVELIADRGRHVATPSRSLGEGERVRNPVSPIPAPVARPRAFGESAIGDDMPRALVDAIDRLDRAGRRQALRVLGRAAESSGFEAACAAEGRMFASGRVPDEASCDMLARRMAAGRGGARPGRPGTLCSVKPDFRL
jgi:transposase